MTDDSTNKVAYLDTLDGSKKVWEIEVNVKGKAVTFKVDTGAEVTAPSDSTWEFLGITTPLKSAGLSLFGPPLNLLGKTTLSLTYNGNTCMEEVFIIKGLNNNLLGLLTIKELSFL